MDMQKLKVTTREITGTGPARRTRRSGELPAVLYGGGEPPLSLKINLRAFEHLVHGRGGEHAVVQLEVEGEPDLNSPALLRFVQHDPVHDNILHADFMRIRLDERITTLVPIVLIGQAEGVIEGGVLDHQTREVEVECLALDVPECLEIDITSLKMGEGYHVRDLVAPESVTIMTDGDRAVATVHVPRVVKSVEEEEAEAAAAAAEAAEEGEEGAAAEGDEGEAKESTDGE